MRLQRLVSGGAELTEVWFEAQSLGSQWCLMTGDNHTPTIDIDATLYSPPWHGQEPSQKQLQLMLQTLLECICLNSTNDVVHQARQALGHCLTAAQLLAYPPDQAEAQALDGEEGKRKLSKIAQQTKTPSSKSITQVPKPEQPQGQPEMPVPNLANSPAIPQQANTSVARVFLNIAPVPEICQPSKTAVSDTAANHTEWPQASTPVVMLEPKNSAPVPGINQPSKTAVSDTAANHVAHRVDTSQHVCYGIGVQK